MLYTDVVICIGPLSFLETWPPIYRGQERTVRDRSKASQVQNHVYFGHAPCLTEFTFEFIRRPTPPILSPSYWTFVELTLVTKKTSGFTFHCEKTIVLPQSIFVVEGLFHHQRGFYNETQNVVEAAHGWGC
jgi:hypothetical protein